MASSAGRGSWSWPPPRPEKSIRCCHVHKQLPPSFSHNRVIIVTPALSAPNAQARCPDLVPSTDKSSSWKELCAPQEEEASLIFFIAQNRGLNFQSCSSGKEEEEEGKGKGKSACIWRNTSFRFSAVSNGAAQESLLVFQRKLYCARSISIEELL